MMSMIERPPSFFVGQELDQAQIDAEKALSEEGGPWYRRVLVRQRRILGILIPAVFFHFFWWAAMIRSGAWEIFTDNYYMTLTMIGGSMMGGMTSVGGGAIAFPVMTLAFDVAPSVARDFGMMIQSCGMTSASFAIFFMRVVVDWPVLLIGSLGGLAGLITGLELLDGLVSKRDKKLGFVSIWFAFAFVLLFLLIFKRGTTNLVVINWKPWKVVVFLVTGFIGGILTAVTGNGIDICTYSIMTLLFKVNEKVATPTSVILMATNSVLCFIWRGVVVREISMQAWRFMAVCVPVVVLGAPLGSVLGSHFHRGVLTGLVILLDIVALVSAFIIIPFSLITGLVMGAIILVGIGFFGLLAYLGHKMNLSTEWAPSPSQKNEEDLENSSIKDLQNAESQKMMTCNDSSQSSSSNSNVNDVPQMQDL